MNFLKGLLNVLVLQHLLLQLCSSLDTIKFDQPVGDGDFLLSKNETFVLGFFSPGTSTNRYVGIWYKFSEDLVVWVANRDNPINGSSGVLSIGSDGNLVLQANTSQGLVPLWSTNVSISSASNGNISAQILDSGSLVLAQQGSQDVFWQSTDHPTNILLSNMKIGLDRRSGINRFLTCWNSDNDPGTGNVSLRMDPNGSPQLILYKDDAKWWRSGQWNGIQWGGIPAVQRNVVFKINFVNNQDEIAVQWTVLDPSIHSVITIDGSGTLNQLSWQDQQHQWVSLWSAPLDSCDSYGKCGQFGNCNPYTNSGFNCTCYPGYEPTSPQDWDLRDGTDGCKRPQGSPSMCRNGEGFVKLENVKVPDTSSIKLENNLSLEACKEECLNNCSCLAYASADVRNGGTGCMTWYRDLMDTKQFTEGGQDLYVRVDAVVLAQYKNKSGGRRRLAIILVVSTSVASLLILAVLCWFRKRSRKGRGGEPRFLNDPAASGVRSYEDLPIKNEVEEHRGDTDLPFFDLTTVVAATENFSYANMLGHGGFGTVYKGCLADGQDIAVKRLSRNSGQGVDEFKNEVMLIAKLQHRNLVRLLGCCIHKEERMLIYEYMPNRSLDLCIFDKNRKSLLDWRKRFQIIIGIARGVLYLHQDSRLKIIHRDLKASNVLLDGSMNPKISDFGMARMFGDDQIEANTNRVVGTYGYMSPEYAMDGLYSIKSDVFSFGVLALEIISGKKNSFQFENTSLNLVGLIWDLWTEGKVLDIVDLSLNQSYSTHEVMRCIQIGLLCVQENATDRPTMLDVVFMLGNETNLPHPKKAAFSFKTGGPDSSTSRGASSVNDVTVTVIEAR
ncbi:LOW QUALITY PROTEIN: G-type lectin S-receptor-like serine/threonine-protein kinase At1g11410 [Pyrus x bretschneideri]|uniref:LOW QUALITY PROTEIN: G-type lectin S-receptor-like serine/threonine-protein kinase At1g11410 n=1 Tax=Pyrus x bretschneideri TaxID=225117 RepID=UPI00202E830E|nr:LOW QUALITY PROTEIN: G-type lectin S-receptor-like serine/threonine-protein kinase At1g11410 [Pyrus x bretschneideri]